VTLTPPCYQKRQSDDQQHQKPCPEIFHVSPPCVEYEYMMMIQFSCRTWFQQSLSQIRVAVRFIAHFWLT
jgi:hypothetical protein